MGKDKKPLNTQWDPATQRWCMSLELHPFTENKNPRKVANFVNEKQEAIELSPENIETIKNLLLAKPEFKNLREEKNHNQNALITGGKSAYQSGYLSSQILAFITFSGITGGVILPYARGIQFPPYQATREETEEYYAEVQDTLQWMLIAGLVSASTGLLMTLLNNQRRNNSAVAKADYEYLENTIIRLDTVADELKLKNKVIEKIEYFLKINNSATDLNHAFTIENTSSSSPANAQKTFVTQLTDNLSSISTKFTTKMSTFLDVTSKLLRRDHRLPEKTVSAPNTLKDWIIFIFDGMDDLNVYLCIDKLLSGNEKDGTFVGCVLDLLKIALYKNYLSEGNLTQDNFNINEIKNVYDLFKFAIKLPFDHPRTHPGKFILKMFITILQNSEKLNIMVDLRNIFKELDLKTEQNTEQDQLFYTDFLTVVEEQLAEKEKEALAIISMRLKHLNLDEEAWFKNSIARLLKGYHELQDLKTAVETILNVLENEKEFKLFVKKKEFRLKEETVPLGYIQPYSLFFYNQNQQKQEPKHTVVTSPTLTTPELRKTHKKSKKNKKLEQMIVKK